MRFIGYGRLAVDHSEERLAAERETLSSHGCSPENTFIEVLPLSAKVWPEFERAKSTLIRGDTLVVSTLGHLVRDIKDLAVLAASLQGRGVALYAIDWNIDTRTDEGKTFVKYLAPLTALESSLRAERQREGIERAKAKGSFKGREPTAQQKTDEVLELRGQGLTIAKIAAALSIGEASVFRIIKKARVAAEAARTNTL